MTWTLAFHMFWPLVHVALEGLAGVTCGYLAAEQSRRIRQVSLLAVGVVLIASAFLRLFAYAADVGAANAGDRAALHRIMEGKTNG